MTGFASIRTLRNSGTVLLLASVASCGATDLVAPFGPVGPRERFIPLPIYRVWHAAIEACAGRQSDFDAIIWWVADSLAAPPSAGADYETDATWTPPHTITLRRDRTGVEWVVKHELIHDLLQNGDDLNPILLRCEPIP